MTNLVQRLSLFLFCSLSLTLGAQEVKTIKPEVHVTYAKKIGRTAALKYLVPRQVTDNAKKKADKGKIRPPRNFVGRFPSRVQNESMEHTGPDKLRQMNINKSMAVVNEPIINVEGLTSGSAPNDPSGDVGHMYYMQAVNATQIGIFNKSDGSLMTSFAANTIWNSIGFTSAGDPIIMYDQEFDRWIITEFAQAGNNLLVAISSTDDPTGEYDVYNFTTPNFPDYPKYAIWPNSYTVTSNEGGPGTLHAYLINREELLAGADAVQIQRVNIPGNTNTEAGFYVATPVDWSGVIAPPVDRDPMFLALNDASWNVGETEDKIEIFSIKVDWDDENNTALERQSLPVSPFDSYPCSSGGGRFSCIPQLGGIGLDAIPEVIMHQVHYRNFGSFETMVLSFITDVTDGENVSGIRWAEFRRTATEEWSVYQEGTFAPADGLHRYMCSIAMDGAGNIGLAYNASSPDDYVGVRYTGRRAGDPLGMMTIDEYELAPGESTISNPFDPSRLGDYSHMTIDPSDDATFWFTTEYAGPNDVRTRIAAFSLRKDTFDIGPLSLKTPVNGSLLSDMEEVEISVQNFGIDTIRNFEVGYIFQNGAEVKEMVDFDLYPDSIYNHTFVTTVDVSRLGDYDIKLFTSLLVDQNILNDTVNAVIRNLPEIDLSIQGINDIGFVCSESADIEVRLLNLGTLDITEATFDVVLNGTSIPEVQLSNSITADGSGLLTFTVDNVINGLNTLDVNVVSVNGNVGDEVDTNNSASATFEATTNGIATNLAITTDVFPGETSWEIVSESGTIVAQGGPYDGQPSTVINEEVCLDPEQCYTFTLFDSYGDGIFAADGGYVLTDENGGVLSSSMTPDFGDQESNDFCAMFMCNVEAVAQVVPASSDDIDDGMIMVEVTNGAGPFTFSIDGGNSFTATNVFPDLAAGDYDVVVQGSGDCIFEFTVTVLACNIDVAVLVTPESDFGAFDGEISLEITGAIGSTLISINGGNTLGTETTFTGLEAGDYDVVVRDSLGCQYMETVHVGNSVAAEDVIIGSVAKIYPNPTEGVFRIELIGVSSNEIYIPMTLYNVKGEVIQRNNLAKYDDGYSGIMSLYHYPAGMYYLKIDNPEIDQLLRVVRK